MKVRICTICNVNMEVPNNSGRLYCKKCIPEHNRRKANEHYHRHKKDGRIIEYRKDASKKLRQKRRDNLQYKLMVSARDRASSKGLEFNLIEDDIFVPDCCPILKTKFKMGTYQTSSIDRIDNSKGYIKGNVQVLSHKANAMKNSATNKELLMFAKWIIKNVPEITGKENDPRFLTTVVKEPNVLETSGHKEIKNGKA